MAVTRAKTLSMTTYKVVLNGVLNGLEVSQVAPQLAVLCKIRIEGAQALLSSPNMVIKRALSLDAAAMYKAALRGVGCKALIEQEAESDSTAPSPAPRPTAESHRAAPNPDQVRQHLSALAREGKNTTVALAGLAQRYATQIHERVRSAKADDASRESVSSQVKERLNAGVSAVKNRVGHVKDLGSRVTRRQRFVLGIAALLAISAAGAGSLGVSGELQEKLLSVVTPKLGPCPGEYSPATWTNCIGEGRFLKPEDHGDEIYASPDGKKYVGEFKDGKFHGKGRWSGRDISDDRDYVGEFRNNQYHGKGTLTRDDGSIYVGTFEDGLFQGQGTMTYANGNKYVGEWKQGRYDGQGTETLVNGDKYVGEWKNGKFYGQGTLTWHDGSKYVGEFKNGIMNGKGTLTTMEGDKYVGEVRDGKLHGQGTRTWANGAKYVGGFKNGKMDGQGSYIWPDGRKYVGEWKNDKRNGQGTYTWANGDQYVGEYRNDVRHGTGEYTYANGQKRVVQYINGKSKEELEALAEERAAREARDFNNLIKQRQCEKLWSGNNGRALNSYSSAARDAAMYNLRSMGCI